ncbi:MAG: 3-dehydroquinate dehydratase [Salinivirgaceae bacterium]|jgi:3-dehydroquinate dehydratase-2|nr:3-dehydroquinate dehydratase [Salinivirgaceae bacterium]
MKITIINGPNLNLVGQREPEIYGKKTFVQYFQKLIAVHPDVEFVYEQSNSEGELINLLQKYGFECDGVVINPGGYSHTSVALADCIAAVPCVVAEVHISNIHARESFRNHTITGAKADVVITGAGLAGYDLAIQFLLGRVVK